MSKAEIIDAYFRDKDFYPWVPYQPIGETIIEEVERMGPDGLFLSTACALIEKESGGKPIFGCDWGGKWTNVPPFCQVRVTKNRVKRLIRNVNQGGGQNGIGYCQLTSIGLVKEAERLGGAHLAFANMRVGFKYLNDLIAQLGWPAGAAAFNAGPSNYRSVLGTYGADMARLEREWAERLQAADSPKEKEEASPVKAKRFWDAIDYLRPAIGNRRTPYWVWEEGIIPNGPGAYAHNIPVPPIENVKRGGIFCAGVTNLILRHAGKRVPTKGDFTLDGGIAAYFSGKYGRGYYSDYDEGFNMVKAKKWADETNCGVMIGQGYFGMSLGQQGHVAILLPRYKDGKHYVLQSFGGYAKWPGLNWDFTIEESNAGGYYTTMVHPENWLLYSGDEY